MCSSTRGPAIAPSLVTCPTSTSAVPAVLAKRVSCAAHSRTCATLPGRGLQRLGIDGLDRIHHRDRGLLLRERGQDLLELDLGQRLQTLRRQAEAACAQRHLLDRLLAAHVQHAATAPKDAPAPAAAASTCRYPDRRPAAPHRRAPGHRRARDRAPRCRSRAWAPRPPAPRRAPALRLPCARPW